MGVDADGGEVASIGWVLQPGQTRQRVRTKTWMALENGETMGNYGKIWENMNLKKQQKGNLVPNSTRI